LASLRDGDQGNFRHIALVETSTSNLVHPITFGNYEVEKLLGWNEESGVM